MTIKAAILPNGRTFFFGPDGQLSGGSVYYYIPDTMTAKTTWQDPGETSANANPVPLDADGSALVYGSGQYRQIVFDALGTQIDDSLTYGIPSNNEGGAGFGQRNSISTAASVNLGSVTTHNALITGIIDVAGFGNSASLENPIWLCAADSSFKLVAGASLIIPGGNDYILQEGDNFLCEFLGAGVWQILAIWPTAGLVVPEQWVANFFDFIPSGLKTGVLQTIRTGTWSGVGPYYLDDYFNAAIATRQTIAFPPGFYHINGTLNMLPGVEFWGAGSDALHGTVIFLGGVGSDWGMQMSNANGTNQVEAFKLRDIFFQVSQNGIRWNRIDGGFTDDASSQAYMMRPWIERCNFGMDSATHRQAVQMNKCFDFKVISCWFSVFQNSLDFEGSDIGLVQNCRFDSDDDYSIEAHSHGTFGSSLAVRDSDFNNPGAGYVNSDYLDILLDFNHMELDGGPMRTSTLNFTGNSFHIKVHNNRIQNGALTTNWISITDSENRFLVSVYNNSTSAPTEMGNVDYHRQGYFTNGGQRALIRHGGNSAGDPGSWPINGEESDAPVPPGYAAMVTGGRNGASYVGLAGDLFCQTGDFTLQPNADATKYLEISDWTGLPGNVMVGTLTVELITAGGAAGQVANWQVLDGGVNVATGTITHTAANAYYKTDLVTSHAFSTTAQIRVWNEDTGTGERVFVHTLGMKIG